MSAAEASMTGGNGWLIIPVNISGIEKEFIFQWGYASGSSTYKVNYPVVFPNNVKCFFAIPNTTLEAGISYLSMANVTPVSNSQATIIVGKVTNGNNELFTRAVHWFAVGY
ncbi:gp53-like domain-containing protein [Mixta calida]|uniref:gp53-like domain-containing protein n=1 Tax=Mixta calida TaxID=665913 RepID=UPI00403B0624